MRHFPQKSNSAAELFADFPYGAYIVRSLEERFLNKLKRRVNTAVVLYDFDWMAHFTGRPLSAMREKKTDSYHIFYVETVYPYR